MDRTQPLPTRLDPPSSERPVRLRRAQLRDIDAIAGIWHAGWRDAHLGNVPAELVQHRTLLDLARLAEQRLGHATVAVADDRVVGFVVSRDDELEQLYVVADARRRGVATALMAHAEASIADRFDTAWLAVVPGNDSARQFYLRRGWVDTGPFDNAAPTVNGPLLVPALRYTKRVHAATGEVAS